MKVSLGLLLAVCLAGLQFVAVAFVVFSSYVTSERALLEHARALLRDAGTNTIEHSKGFLLPASGAAELATRLAENQVIASDNLAVLEKLLFQQLQIAPQFAGVFYGEEDGTFVYVKRNQGMAPFRSKIIRQEAAGRVTDLVWRDNNFAVVRREQDPVDTYDPRTRPWYVKAAAQSETIWTEPYIFFTSKEPGITVASPVYDEEQTLLGVIGVDIEIAQISEFLSLLEIGENGKALIINNNGDVIAHPDRSLISTKNPDGSLRFVSIAEIGDPIARAAFGGAVQKGQIPTQSEIESGFVHQKASYVSILKPAISKDIPWTIALYAPEQDFTGAIEQKRLQNFQIAAVIAVLSGIVGLMLARLIYRPVEAFAVRSALISQGEISASDPMPKTYKELDRVNETLVHEIAERKKSEREYGRTFDYASRGMAQVEPETGRILRANARFGEVFGYDDAAILDRTIQDLAHPDDVEDVLVLAGGDEVDTEYVHEKRFLRSDGAVVWADIHAIMIRDAQGEPLHAVVTVEDLTGLKLKEKEIQQLNRDLVHTARVNMMGHMATSLAHELNQPLTAITQNMDAALNSVGPAADADALREILTESEQQAHRAGDIIRSLRDLLRKDEIRKAEFDLRELIAQTLHLVGQEARVNGVALRISADDMRAVSASRVQIAQVIMNLVRNGIEAIAQSTSNSRRVTVTATQNDKWTVVTVADTGPGFDTDFDPFARFETTKKDGMGLGLSICQTIVEAHGGKLWFDREDDQSCFSFSIPRTVP